MRNGITFATGCSGIGAPEVAWGARTDTRWFDAYCAHWHKNFIRGRLQFTLPDGKTGSAPFPSMIVYFGIER